MTPAEHERPGAVQDGGERGSGREAPEQRQTQEEKSAEQQAGKARPAGRAPPLVLARCGGLLAAQEHPRDRARPDQGDLHRGYAGQQHQRTGREREQAPPHVRGKRARHSDQGLGDDCHRRDLEAMDRRQRDRALQLSRDQGEAEHQQGGGQAEGGPGGRAAERAGAVQANAEADLAGGGAGQELGQADKLGEGYVVQPAAADHQFLPEIAEMRDRPSERSASQTKEGQKHFADRPGARPGRRAFFFRDNGHWRSI